MKGSIVVSCSFATSRVEEQNRKERETGWAKAAADHDQRPCDLLHTRLTAKENLNPNSNFVFVGRSLLESCFSQWKKLTRLTIQTSRICQSEIDGSSRPSPAFSNGDDQEYNSNEIISQARLLTLRKYLLAMKEMQNLWIFSVKEEKLLRTVDQLAEKQLLAKAFRGLGLPLRAEALAKAHHHLKSTETKFQVFDEWKRYYLRRLMLREKSSILAGRICFSSKLGFMESLCHHQSKTELEFVKERLAIRFDRERLLRLFYPFRYALDQLISIRIASIKLSMWLGANRKKIIVKRLSNHSKRTSQLLRSYRLYKEKERLRCILSAMLQQSQMNFVKRKQYQLSKLFYRTHLQRKIFESMIARTEDGRPLRYPIKALKKQLERRRCLTFIRRLQQTTQTSVHIKATTEELSSTRLNRCLRLMQNSCTISRLSRQSNWQLRKKIVVLKKKLQNKSKLVAIQILLAHTRLNRSHRQLAQFAVALHQRRLLTKSWDAIAHC